MIDDAITFLTATLDASKSPATSALPAVPESCIETLTRILNRWPRSYIVPVFDLTRLMVIYVDVFTSEHKDAFLAAILKASAWDAPWSKPVSSEKKAGTTLLFRTLANMFGDDIDVGDGQYAMKVGQGIL